MDSCADGDVHAVVHVNGEELDEDADRFVRSRCELVVSSASCAWGREIVAK